LGDGFAGVKWTSAHADTPMKALIWGLFLSRSEKDRNSDTSAVLV
jgi:hypothetical protein